MNSIKVLKSLSSSHIKDCAMLMASSPPWNELYFTEVQCVKNLSDSNLDIYIVEFENLFVGFLAIRATGFEGEPLLEYICIKQNYRGKGIGKFLLNYIEKSIFPKNDNIYLLVSDINPRAISLYENVGYERVGSLENYNLWGQTEFIYRKFRRPRQEQFIPQSNLTKDQNEGQEKGALDLNAGYAQIPLSNVLKECVIDGTKSAIFGSTNCISAKTILHDSVSNLLDLPTSLRGNVRSTFSGSIALNRVFRAIGSYMQNQPSKKMGLTVVLPEPSIDLWQLLLSEQLLRENRDVQIKSVKQEFYKESSRISNLIEELDNQFKRTPNRQLMVIIDSPSNPLGIVTSIEEIEKLARACGKVGAILVVDHCFLLAGLHAPKKLPTIFNISDNLCEWVGIWDTGKSIDVAGDKIGFIIPSSIQMTKYIDEALSVIHPETSNARRMLEVFSRILSSPCLQSYLEEVGDICRKNLAYLKANAHQDWSISSPEAGTFACIYFKDSDLDSYQLRTKWMEKGVNVAAGKSFFRSSAKEGIPFLRISLVRNFEYFRKAIEQI